jgi:UDP:flavonoid glycosyltransferase YjiC (YdhE family)
MQVVCPFLLDQFYWAERLHWLGVAPEPLQKQYLIPDNEDALNIHNAAEVLVGAIRSALSPEIKAQATRVADRLSNEVCRLTLQLLSKGNRPTPILFEK